MAVGAFKTKYTGEQMEKLFDKLSTTPAVPSAGEGQYYTMEIAVSNNNDSGGWFRSQTIETNFGTLSFTGLSNVEKSGCTDISSLLTTTSRGVKLSDPTTLTYTFKKPVVLLRLRCSGSTGTLYYWINDAWVNQGAVNNGTTNITNRQPVTKVKIDFPSNSNGTLKYSIFDFMSDEYIISGPTIKNGTL